MFFNALPLLPLLGLSALACPDHSFHKKGHQYLKRAETSNITWAYEASYDWGRLSEDFHLCQMGSQQSPVPLLLTQGLSLNHMPHFSFPNETHGEFFNWGYGPAMTFAHAAGNYSTLPSFTFDENGTNETVYMTGWHIHSPADHSVQGDRSKSELHFVHVNAKGAARSVLAFRIDPGNTESAFFDQLPEMISFRNSTTRVNATMNPSLALDEVKHFEEFWTYKGSLTSPPCTEGIRWFIARNTLFLGVEQMQTLLVNSIYSARAEQRVWRHQINA